MKYGPSIAKAICGHISIGVSQKDAAALEDITEETFYAWMKAHPEFSESVLKARLKCKERNIKLIQKAAITKWTAAAWYLERTYPDEYALRLQHTGRNGGPIEHRHTVRPEVMKKMDEATLERLSRLAPGREAVQ